jgi:hypothetical protein
MQQFFEDSRIIEPLHQGPLTEHLGSYILLLKHQGYSRSSAQAHILLISRFSQWLERNGIETCTVDAMHAAAIPARLQTKAKSPLW